MSNAAIILLCAAFVCVTLWDALRRYIGFRERMFADTADISALWRELSQHKAATEDTLKESSEAMNRRMRAHEEKTVDACGNLAKDMVASFAKIGAQDITEAMSPHWRKNG